MKLNKVNRKNFIGSAIYFCSGWAILLILMVGLPAQRRRSILVNFLGGNDEY